MADQDNKNPSTGSESDISKSQFGQQPPQANQQSTTGQQSGSDRSQPDSELSGDQAETGQSQDGSKPDEGMQGDTLAQQRTDVEGGSLGSQEGGQAGSGFVGSQGRKDSSSELIDEEGEDFKSDGQGATDNN